MDENNNRKFFGLTLNGQKSFSLIIYDIKQIFAWSISIISKITISSDAYALARFIQNIRIRHRITYIFRTLGRLFFNNNNKIRLTYTTKLLARYINNVKIYLRLSPASKALAKVFTSIKIPKILLMATISVAEYIKLLTYDPLILDNVDYLTLSQMDIA